MKLRAKIKPEHLTEICKGKQDVEYRQFESIELVDTITKDVFEFDIVDVRCLNDVEDRWVRNIKHGDIKWNKNEPIYGILLGKRIK